MLLKAIRQVARAKKLRLVTTTKDVVRFRFAFNTTALIVKPVSLACTFSLSACEGYSATRINIFRYSHILEP